MNVQNPTSDLQSQLPDLQSQSQPPHQDPGVEIEIEKHAHAFSIYMEIDIVQDAGLEVDGISAV